MSSISASSSSASTAKLAAIIQQQIQAPAKHGRSNLMQIVDKLDISPEAKKLAENSIAQQIASDQADGSSSDSQAAVQPGTSVTNAQIGSDFTDAVSQLQQGQQDLHSAISEIANGQGQGQTDLTNALKEVSSGHKALHSALNELRSADQASNDGTSSATNVSQADGSSTSMDGTLSLTMKSAGAPKGPPQGGPPPGGPPPGGPPPGGSSSADSSSSSSSDSSASSSSSTSDLLKEIMKDLLKATSSTDSTSSTDESSTLTAASTITNNNSTSQTTGTTSDSLVDALNEMKQGRQDLRKAISGIGNSQDQSKNLANAVKEITEGGKILDKALQGVSNGTSASTSNAPLQGVATTSQGFQLFNYITAMSPSQAGNS
jgi:hypothetical protein